MQTEGLKLVVLTLALVLLTSSQILHSNKKVNDKKIDVIAKADKKATVIEEVKVEDNINEPLVGTLEGKEITIEKWYNVRISYYTNSYSDCGKTDNIGANNIRLSRGMGAFPPEFEFGSKMFIEGIGIIENQDRGGAIKIASDGTIHIDVYVPNASRKQLLKMGVKYTRGKFVE